MKLEKARRKQFLIHSICISIRFVNVTSDLNFSHNTLLHTTYNIVGYEAISSSAPTLCRRTHSKMQTNFVALSCISLLLNSTHGLVVAT